MISCYIPLFQYLQMYGVTSVVVSLLQKDSETITHIIFESSYIEEKIRRQVRYWLSREGCGLCNIN